MERLTYVNIAGKNYPMSFSLQAMRLLAKKLERLKRLWIKYRARK